ncbi:metallophosphoesterase [Methanobacterium paludis]|uniref:Metallophosphoesterase n=1 Tax=Methanobacterium paludis (strain DSM 25820 / JCM 18151 / SWAN1) TaxID=868131 RepID=F6D1P7_METPW|nr:metallophosphoesterase [Methanobacterium paludis]AEG17850.1 metallophosphoesterase [Methanobacterium paludis]
MVKFLHTADWHLGIKYAQLGPKADIARKIRMETIKRLLETARERNVDFILVAGDLFDSNDVDSKIIHEVCSDLSGTYLPVYILPGNHDPLTRDSPYNNPIWDAAENIHILKEAEPLDIQDNVTLYPCPVNQKQSQSDPTEWINPENNHISIGLAHGNLQIPGFTDESNFPINPRRADISNLDYLALGEWHSFFQYEKCTVYPGTPETTKFGENTSGNVVFVDIERSEDLNIEAVKTIKTVTPNIDSVKANGPTNLTIEPVKVGKLNWETMNVNITSLEDVENLENTLKTTLNPDYTILNLKLKGVVGQDAFDYLEHLNVKDLFFFNLKTDELYLKPNMLEFKAMIPEGSYVPRTFKALMALMKYDPMTQELSSISPEDAEEIFKDIKDVDSIQNASPEVLKRASLMLYQMVKAVSQ